MFVYVCSPYSGDREAGLSLRLLQEESNVQNAKRYSRFVVEQGHQPVTPHLLYPQFLDDDSELERTLGLAFGIALLPVCQEIWVFGDRISEGMAREIEDARSMIMPIRRFTGTCEEVGRE